MPLTRVYVLSKGKGGSSKVEVSDVLDNRVSRYSNFFCMLCGQDVSFCDPYDKRAHFKHTKNPGKTCVQKTVGLGPGISVSPRAKSIRQDVFVRINPSSALSDMHIEIGFPPVHAEMFGRFKKSKTVVEVSRGNQLIKTVIPANDLNPKNISYFDLNDCFSESYYVKSTNLPDHFHGWDVGFFWLDVPGFDPNGMVFSGSTGKRVPYQGVVYVGQEYFCVFRGSNEITRVSSVERRKLFCDGEWSVWKIKPLVLNSQTFSAFIRLGVQLNIRGDCVFPVWPSHTQCQDLVRINEGEERMFSVVVSDMLRSGDLDTFGLKSTLLCCEKFASDTPTALIEKEDSANLYVWRCLLDEEGCASTVSAKDPDDYSTNTSLSFSKYKDLPVKKRLLFTPRHNGRLEIQGKRGLRDRRLLKAGKDAYVEVSRGDRIKVYQGLDCIGVIEFSVQENLSGAQQLSDRERSFLKSSGSRVKNPSRYNNLVARVSGVPELADVLRSDIAHEKLTYKTLAVVRKKLFEGGR